MSKKQRIKELEQRVAELERELDQYRPKPEIWSEPAKQSTVYVLDNKDINWHVRPRWYVEPFETSSVR